MELKEDKNSWSEFEKGFKTENEDDLVGFIVSQEDFDKFENVPSYVHVDPHLTEGNALKVYKHQCVVPEKIHYEDFIKEDLTTFTNMLTGVESIETLGNELINAKTKSWDEVASGS